MSAPLRIVIWSDGKPGHDSQVCGMLGCVPVPHQTLEIKLPVETPTIAQLERKLALQAVAAKTFGRKPARALIEQLIGNEDAQQLARLMQFVPQLSIAAGRRGGLYSFSYARLMWIPTIQAMTHPLLHTGFTLDVIPAHDRKRPGEGVVITKTAANPFLPEVAATLAEQFRAERVELGLASAEEATYWSLLVGGPAAGEEDSAVDVEGVRAEVAFLLRRLGEIEGETQRAGQRALPLRLLVSTSRRTPAALADALHALCQGNARVAFFQDFRTDDRRTAGALIGLAEQVLLTPDSISMVSEALWAGRGVTLLPLKRDARSQPVIGSAKHRRFIEALLESEPVRWFGPAWEPPLSRRDPGYRHPDFLAIQTGIRQVIRDVAPEALG